MNLRISQGDHNLFYGEIDFADFDLRATWQRDLAEMIAEEPGRSSP